MGQVNVENLARAFAAAFSVRTCVPLFYHLVFSHSMPHSNKGPAATAPTLAAVLEPIAQAIQH